MARTPIARRARYGTWRSAVLASAALATAGLWQAPLRAQGSGAQVSKAAPANDAQAMRDALVLRSKVSQVPAAPQDAPNILLILTDDVGFSASSTFGGPVPTPTLDRLAARGVRFNQFHTTAMCSPTRAALLTGRNQHAIGMGKIQWTGEEGYTSVIPESAAMIPEVLKENGYATAAFGKWHLTPTWEQSQSGPFTRWPTGEGFDHFYGFLGHDSSQWQPDLVVGTSSVDSSKLAPDYHLDQGMADNAIAWIREQKALAPAKPFFMYYATGTAHAPHHAPKAWIDRFKGKFSEGWDAWRSKIHRRQLTEGIIPQGTALTPRPADLPSWDSLSADQKRLYARQMEVFAGALAHADYQIGRVIDALEKDGQLDNTMIVFIQGDNGASPEGGLSGAVFEQTRMNGREEDEAYALTRIDDLGGPDTYNHYHAGWGWALSTPFQYYKQVASHFGGTRNGAVISWPGHIRDEGGLRQQFHYVTDIAPTLYEAAGVSMPKSVKGVEQMPLDGVSMVYALNRKDAPSTRKTQYFEMQGNVAIYSDGWVAATHPTKPPWEYMTPTTHEPLDGKWELYNVSKDFSQAHDLAAREPARLAQLKALFFEEAERNKVLPVRAMMKLQDNAPSLTGGQKVFEYPRGMAHIESNVFAPVGAQSYSIAATVDLASNGEKGVIVAHGGRFGGWSLFLKDGRPAFHYNALDPFRYEIVSPNAVPAGKHEVRADVRYNDKPGTGGSVTLFVDGVEVGKGNFERSLPYWNVNASEGADIGIDRMTAVSPSYDAASSSFSGQFDRVVITLLEDKAID